MAKNNVNALSDDALGSASGGTDNANFKKVVPPVLCEMPSAGPKSYNYPLSNEQLCNVSGGRTQLTPEQIASIKDELRKNDGGLGYAKKCQELDITPKKEYLSQFVIDQLGL